MQPPFDLGILFVHGIGEQRKGDTLLATAEPLIRWIARSLSAEASVDFKDAKLDLANLSRDYPAHALLSVGPRRLGTFPQQDWLLAESWWAADVRPPEFFKLAGWMLTTGAWMIVSHFLRHSRRPSIWAKAWSFLKLSVFGLPLVLLTQVIVAALAIVAAFPIPKLRKALSGALLQLTGVIGDTYVFVENKLQQAAIISDVRRHLEWLSLQCRTVAVIAHSQGAAVAHRAFKSANLGNTTLLITYGSGIAKLEEIEWVSRNNPDTFREAYLSVPLSALSAFIAARLFFTYSNDPWGSRAALWGGTAALSLIAVLIKAWNTREALRQHMSSLSLLPYAQWCDIYASRDPVPNGSIPDVPGIVSVEVKNFSSSWSDHTTYWENTAEFIPEVAKRVLKAAGLGNLWNAECHDKATAASKEHRFCLGALVAVRWATLCSFVLVPWEFSDRLPALGQSVHLMLMRSPLQGVLKNLEALGNTTSDLLAPATWTAGLRTEKEMTLLGVALLVLPIAGWFWTYQLIWRSWNKRAGEIFVKFSDVSSSLNRPLTRILVPAAGFLPLLVALIMFVRPEWIEAPGAELRLYRLAGRAFSALFLLILAVTSYAVVRQGRKKGAATVVGDLVAIVVWAGVSLVFVVPGVATQKVQQIILSLVWPPVLFLITAQDHIRVVNRLSGGVSRTAATVFPFAMILLLWLSIWLGPVPQPVIEIPAATAGIYALGWLVVRGILSLPRFAKWLTAKLLRRSPPESARAAAALGDRAAVPKSTRQP